MGNKQEKSDLHVGMTHMSSVAVLLILVGFALGFLATPLKDMGNEHIGYILFIVSYILIIFNASYSVSKKYKIDDILNVSLYSAVGLLVLNLFLGVGYAYLMHMAYTPNSDLMPYILKTIGLTSYTSLFVFVISYMIYVGLVYIMIKFLSQKSNNE